MSPVGPNGERLPYPGEAGAPVGPGGPPPQLPMDPAQQAPPPPETMDGAAMPMPDFGASLDPGSLAQIAMQAIAEQAQLDQAAFAQMMEQAAAEFTMRQEASIAQAMPAMEAIIAQLGMAPPETMDAPVTAAPEEMPPEEVVG